METYHPLIIPFVQSWDIFINYIRKKGFLELTPSEKPKNADCLAINELFVEEHQQHHLHPKTQYDKYTFVRHLFEVCFAMKFIIKTENQKGKTGIKLNPEMLEEYDLMNVEEKYLSFLKGFWFEYEFNTGIYQSNYQKLENAIRFLTKKPTIKTYPVENGVIDWGEKQNYAYRWYDEEHFSTLFSNLGLWELKVDNNIKLKRSYNMSNLISITTNEFGLKMFEILTKKFPFWVCNNIICRNDTFYGFFDEPDEDVDDIDADKFEKILALKYPHFDFQNKFPTLKTPFASFFQKVLPNAETILERKIKTEKNVGNFYFKVELKYFKGVYRTIAIPSTDTMEDLHLAIQKAFEFENDHMYMFSMDMKGYRSNFKISCPDDEPEGNVANEVAIEDIDWQPKHKFLYIFDFGDNWEFVCQLQKIDKEEPLLKKYKIVETVGKAPKQYDNW